MSSVETEKVPLTEKVSLECLWWEIFVTNSFPLFDCTPQLQLVLDLPGRQWRLLGWFCIAQDHCRA